MASRGEETIEFAGSKNPTIGVEIELQLIDPASRRLVNAAPRVLGHFPTRDRIKAEMMQAQIELNTAKCRDVAQVRTDLKRHLATLHRVCAQERLLLAATGTHPLSEWRAVLVTDDARYQELAQRLQWLARRFVIFGLHVHVGVGDGDKAVALCDALRVHLPLLLGITASSPYWQGRDSGLSSTRAKIFDALNTAGLPPRLRSWAGYGRHVDGLLRTGVISSIREIWWDLRPHARNGTLEIRVCDGVNTLSEIVSVTAFVQALVVWLGDRHDAGEPLPRLPRWIVRENKWRACRWGCDARLILDEQGRDRPLREQAEALLADLAPVARRLRSESELQALHRLLRNPSYERQRAVFRSTGSLEAVVDAGVAELRDDRPHAIAPA